ncbi:MAG: acetamidase/formamidase family protein [Thermoleophilaceae bacterium]|nr:acetamidase/formamidase family protein [Thermoleophilaceae bacterium]MDQ3320575.1 acetamidase/formamidase family protein [Actinomycetota bacterium]
MFVPGATFFVGDSHYAQGDAEVADRPRGAAARHFRLTVLKAGSRQCRPKEAG